MLGLAFFTWAYLGIRSQTMSVKPWILNAFWGQQTANSFPDGSFSGAVYQVKIGLETTFILCGSCEEMGERRSWYSCSAAVSFSGKSVYLWITFCHLRNRDYIPLLRSKVFAFIMLCILAGKWNTWSLDHCVQVKLRPLGIHLCTAKFPCLFSQDYRLWFSSHSNSFVFNS